MLTPSRLTRGVRSYGIDTQLDSDIADTQAIREFNNQPADFLADRATALEVEITYATFGRSRRQAKLWTNASCWVKTRLHSFYSYDANSKQTH